MRWLPWAGANTDRVAQMAYKIESKPQAMTTRSICRIPLGLVRDPSADRWRRSPGCIKIAAPARTSAGVYAKDAFDRQGFVAFQPCFRRLASDSRKVSGRAGKSGRATSPTRHTMTAGTAIQLSMLQPNAL